ncbi:hypothetical protein BKH41_01785 [Helicobacter sp. 12S02232-10]|nr:hypothetical protein BKH41_01785 [Helicobacter sp. 12S02232-10]
MNLKFICNLWIKHPILPNQNQNKYSSYKQSALMNSESSIILFKGKQRGLIVLIAYGDRNGEK